MLNVFEPCTLQLGDKSFYTFREADRLGIVSLNHWHRLQNASLFPQLHRYNLFSCREEMKVYDDNDKFSIVQRAGEEDERKQGCDVDVGRGAPVGRVGERRQRI